MNRRRFLALSTAALAVAGPAVAQDVVAEIRQTLERRGYNDITVSRTWLGRSRILASGPKGTREIIVNPATGEILRDLTTRSGAARSSGDLLGEDDTDSGGSGSSAGDESGDDRGGDDSGGDDSGGGDDGGGDDGGGDDGGGGGDGGGDGDSGSDSGKDD